ncbi:hypothetical protein ABIA32_003837 [Streptacidiphilus sp. MAP12-20]|uniref:hypothetical protein n=1 Tax=Streptacidiphilus sp. MAP12-20 TaxID=3156299 RepID=UPI0035150C18
MNRGELQRALDTAGIRPDIYSLHGGLPDQALCLGRRGKRWVVYYSERGSNAVLAVYDTEDAACQAMYERIIGD